MLPEMQLLNIHEHWTMTITIMVYKEILRLLNIAVIVIRLYELKKCFVNHKENRQGFGRYLLVNLINCERSW